MSSPATLEALHREVDARARDVAARNAGRLRCARGCASCCTDGLTVLPVEAERIRLEHAELIASGEPHPEGACAFLDAEGACRIYDSRPYVCRTQGLPLRWFEEDEHDEIVEQRDICPLNLEGAPLSALADDACWTIGPYEERLVELGRGDQRIALRDLFSRTRRRSSCSR